jgi:hypothetical protein
MYEIQIEGCLEDRWLRWFEGLEIHQPEGKTIIRGPMDQAALHGILSTIRDLGMEIISVQRANANEHSDPGSGPS